MRSRRAESGHRGHKDVEGYKLGEIDNEIVGALPVI